MAPIECLASLTQTLKYVSLMILKVIQCLFTLVEFEDATLSREMQYGKDHETRDANKNVNLWTLLKRVIGHKPILVRSHAHVPEQMLSLTIEKKFELTDFDCAV